MNNLQTADSLRYRIKGIMYQFLPGMITCREFETFIIEYFEGDLSEEQANVFERHLKVCRECREYLAAYKRTVEITASGSFVSYQSPSENMPEDLITAIQHARQA